jgi:gluconolactonase
MTRSCKVWRFVLCRDTVVAKARCIARIPVGTSGPDGLAMDGADRLYVVDPGHGCIWVIDRHGVPLPRVVSNAGRITTNCVLTPDGRSLGITESETNSIPIAEIPHHERHLRIHL